MSQRKVAKTSVGNQCGQPAMVREQTVKVEKCEGVIQNICLAGKVKGTRNTNWMVVTEGSRVRNGWSKDRQQ